jgi:hypothetical protein
MSVIVLPANGQNRPIIMAAIAGGQTSVLWTITATLSYVWDGAVMARSNSPNTFITDGYQIIASTLGMVATLPNPPGIPATDTVPANYGGMELNNSAMSADDWAVLYWQSQGM